MMVDTSALIAVLKQEPDAATYVNALTVAASPMMATPTYLESCIVATKVPDPAFTRRLDRLITESGIELIPFTERAARIAAQAYRDFGKGSRHAANLNYGDCVSYGAAIERGLPLLWKGNDFGHTGIASALDTHP